jgi:serine protease Do
MKVFLQETADAMTTPASARSVAAKPGSGPSATRRKIGRGLMLLGLGTSLAVNPIWFPIPARADAVSGLSSELPSFAPMVEKVLPAVVNISVVQKTSADDDGDDGDGGDNGGGGGMPPGFPGGTPFDEFLRRFFEQQQQGQHGGTPQMAPGQKIMSLGSGFIIDPKGYIVTNNHVIGDAAKVTVIFQDDSRHVARIVGKDEKSDLALLKIDAPKPLPYVSFGDSDKARVGDWVIAVGDPFGLGGTVTKGIISARGRPIEDSSYVDFLQIDAAINKGNSGGPTFDLDGHVIGINTAIYSPNGGSVGIGFAIPSNTAKPVIAQLMEHGKVERGWLGVQIQEVTSDIAQGLGLDAEHPTGALVAAVTPGSPAAKAGLQVGDVIETFDGQQVAKMRDLPRLVGETPINKTVPVTVLRAGKTVTVQTTVGKLTDAAIAQTQNPTPQEQEDADHPAALGLYLSSLNPDVRKHLGISKTTQGALVSRVKDGSPAANNGIEAGDVIMQVNQQQVTGPEDAAKLIKAREKKAVLLLINRHGENRYVAITPNNADGSDDDGDN